MASMKSSFAHTRKIKASSFTSALETVKSTFMANGWGLPPGTTSLNFKEIFASKKVDDNFPNMHVFGFCHPQSAHRALTTEPAVAVLLPCNVVVLETSPGEYEVATIAASIMGNIIEKKEELKSLITEIDGKLIGALDALPNQVPE